MTLTIKDEETFNNSLICKRKY